jgi:hypothetical protein
MFQYSRYFIGLVLVGAGLCACADQGEGQRCDPLNGNNDCASGLICVKAEKLASVDVGAVCCPPAGQNSNPVPECRGQLQTGSGGPVMPVPPSGDAASSSDAASDASSDASP